MLLPPSVAISSARCTPVLRAQVRTASNAAEPCPRPRYIGAVHTLLISTSRPAGHDGEGAASRMAPTAEATTASPSSTTKIPKSGSSSRISNHSQAARRQDSSDASTPIASNISARRSTKAATSAGVPRRTTTKCSELTPPPVFSERSGYRRNRSSRCGALEQSADRAPHRPQATAQNGARPRRRG